MATMSEVQTMIPTWTIGERLGKAREWVDMKQDEMADALDVGRRSVIRYESSATPPRKIILAYASVTGIPLWWLQGYDSEDDAVRSRCFWELALPLWEDERWMMNQHDNGCASSADATFRPERSRSVPVLLAA